MKQETAIDLIACPQLTTNDPQTWADLGSGDGTFTKALASHLGAGSQIIALDRDAQALNRIPSSYEGVQISTQVGEMTQIPSEMPKLHGILMANSFHYIQDKKAFIQYWESAFGATPAFLIVEYDTSRSNSWVPYPIRPAKLSQLFQEMSYRNIVKLREIPSLYHNKIYATIITK